MNKKMDEPNIFIQLPKSATETLADPAMVMYWKNLENRTLWISDEIDCSTMDLIDYVMFFNREDKDTPVEQRKPIRILINSPGGSLDVADSLISMFKLSKTPIYTYAMGMVASAASLIYLAGHKRFALTNAYWIFHEGSCNNMGGNFAEIKAAMRDYEKSVEKMTQFYIDNTNFTEDEVRTNIKSDWYLYQTEALEKGIVHEIMTDISDLL